MAKMAHYSLDDAFGELDRKVAELNNLVKANDFMITCLREEREVLSMMDREETRDMLRERARGIFSPAGGEAPDADVLAILEQALGSGHTAEIIPFPGVYKSA
ncbi:hypothetical protein SAMN04488118_105228 [Epibacterium ulvae]|uniref:Uncharacterized protein n=2 Tax=Epibacterium ulvae TaxID=1156985 RepID=A0A1G5QSY0_9RHOB|nr:hypothetical protein SAMN04488118_105228 [Epibacterium ulvae]